jgi:hypothetical protein
MLVVGEVGAVEVVGPVGTSGSVSTPLELVVCGASGADSKLITVGVSPLTGAAVAPPALVSVTDGAVVGATGTPALSSFVSLQPLRVETTAAVAMAKKG